MNKRVEMWFDLSCPYAYLGSTQIEALVDRVGAELDARPMLLGGVFKAHAVPQKLFSVLSPAKARHNALDLVRWSERFGVPYAMPDGHPFRTVDALRAMLAIGPPFMPLAHAFFRAYWVEGRDIGDKSVIASVLAAAGHDAARVIAEAETPRIKDELRARTDQAIAKGVFGAPTFFVDDQPFWGQDRLGDVEAALGGSTPPLTSALATGAATSFYFDLSCPYVTLALPRVVAAFPRVVFKPVALDDLLIRQYPPHGELPATSVAKRAYMERDLARRAPDLLLDRTWPLASTRTALGFCALVTSEHADRAGAVIEALARETWVLGRDPDDPSVLMPLARTHGIEPLVLRAAAGEGEPHLDANLADAEAADVFGVPTVVTGRTQSVFFGADRVELAIDHARST